MPYDAIVIGGAQAGLSAGYFLARHRRRFLILDAHSRVGDGWRLRWDSLRLFTPARYSSLPGLPFPAPRYHLPSRDEMADYLEHYARHFALPVRLGARVEAVRMVDGRFEVRAGEERLHARNVVVATGPFQHPRVPAFAAALEPDIAQLHSSEYRNPAALPAGDTLVVGAANSGAQIALELAASRPVWLAGRPVGHLPRRLLGRDVYDWLWPLATGVSADSWLGRRLRAKMLGHGDPLVGMTESELAGAGIRRVGRVSGVRNGRPELEDGRVLDVAAVVWCTGFRPDYPWLDLPVLDAEGRIRQHRGITDVPGLYVLGQRFQARPASSLVGGVGRDAREVVAHLVRRPARPGAAPRTPLSRSASLPV